MTRAPEGPAEGRSSGLAEIYPNNTCSRCFDCNFFFFFFFFFFFWIFLCFFFLLFFGFWFFWGCFFFVLYMFSYWWGRPYLTSDGKCTFGPPGAAQKGLFPAGGSGAAGPRENLGVFRDQFFFFFGKPRSLAGTEKFSVTNRPHFWRPNGAD